MSSSQIHANELQKKIEPVRWPAQELIRRREQGPVQDVAPQVAYRRIQLNRDGLRPADLLALQRAVGNRAVQRMLTKANDEQQDEAAEEDSERAVQTKRTVGAPEDVYEQGADRVADQVMTMPDAAAQRPNRSGLPDGLKSGVESLSGISLDSVNVHHNSSQPAQLNALAYTQGSDIHVAPGQEQHLPHEAWHFVQQAQGRVQPTMQMKDGVLVNDDEGLEQEADAMGAKALASAAQLAGGPEAGPKHYPSSQGGMAQLAATAASVAQCFADYYAWGTANKTPHVHVYNSGMHLKTAGGHRYNVVSEGQRAAAADQALENVQGKGNRKLRQTIKHTARDRFGIDL